MRVTIIADDDTVLVDGEPQKVDCSQLFRDGIHAVQWYDKIGEVEYRAEIDFDTATLTREPNATITDLSPFQSYVDEWESENAKAIKKQQKQKQK
jgi:hypothetical protein